MAGKKKNFLPISKKFFLFSLFYYSLIQKSGNKTIKNFYIFFFFRNSTEFYFSHLHRALYFSIFLL